ncbi:MAG: Low-specificity L-threonine aldolase [uncultured Truepera sp.]|uniref:Low-specificity L-threonine aldolase n=1 Tax=uncultured Truepera sp. TaxID=543023 RepID=A0A6J4UYN9_9DEIN|nr:MAG: Low-specificity L-threonine aldolase [uncultured Truepera sp.]
MEGAEVGDDVYAEDPTVNRLQDALAERAGFEAGLLMPSGTMSNQVAIAVHTRRGEEVIIPEGAHVYEYELGSMAVISGALPRAVPAPLGVPEVADIRAAVHRSVHQAPTGLIVLENTHNKAGGTVVPLERCREVGQLAREEGLPLHLDGARGFNAVASLGTTLAEFCAPFDSVSLCLSKGLAAPVGTVLLGSREFIREAHRYRKMLGGGMRQAGVVAAAGLVAVETMTERLGEDHARARTLAEGLARLPGVEVNLAAVQTNMVYLDVTDAGGFAQRMEAAGVRVGALGPRTVRLVTHYEVTDDDVRRTLETAERNLAAVSA